MDAVIKRPRNDSESTESSETTYDQTAGPICSPDEVGEPFGKELKKFDIRESNFRANVIQKFDNSELDKAMGVTVS